MLNPLSTRSAYRAAAKESEAVLASTVGLFQVHHPGEWGRGIRAAERSAGGRTRLYMSDFAATDLNSKATWFGIQ
jgi:hypothetical protein